MAPLWPEEVDVFSVPHSRMKELVQRYLDMMSSINFADVVNLTTLVESLFNTFRVFKAHEQIENKYIMRRLRQKLQALSITNRAVCNCHKDSRLSKMLSLLQQGHSLTRTSDIERMNFGMKLRQALEDFTEQFLPHMEEEEEVFQPMLVEYFSYEELKEIKAKVIKKHLIQEQCDVFSVEKCVEDALSSESSDEETETVFQKTGFDHLPYEVKLKINSYLTPRDLGRCAQVCQSWNVLAMDGSLWTEVYPVSWANGVWTFQSIEMEDFEAEEDTCDFVYDEDADIDESVADNSADSYTNIKQAHKESHMLIRLVDGLLPRVGAFVKKCSLAFSKGLCSGMVHKLLKLCPNLEHLDLKHSSVTDVAFKGFGMDMCGKKLKHLNLSGCMKITDLTLERLACAMKFTLSSSTSTASHDIEDVHPSNSDLRFNHKNCLLQESSRLNSACSHECHRKTSTDFVIPCCSSEDNVAVSCDVPVHATCTLISACKPKCSPHRCCNKKRTSVCGVSWADKDLTAEIINLSINDSVACTGLEFLSLSGCYQITDVGLRSLAGSMSLSQLQYLDLSGCVDITADGLAALVESCPSLDHTYLFYCDNLADDPYSTTASSCQNLECSTRYCCRVGD